MCCAVRRPCMISAVSHPGTNRPLSLKDSLAKPRILLEHFKVAWLSLFLGKYVLKVQKRLAGLQKRLSWHLGGHIPDTSQPWPHFSCPSLRTPFFSMSSWQFCAYYTLESERWGRNTLQPSRNALFTHITFLFVCDLIRFVRCWKNLATYFIRLWFQCQELWARRACVGSDE